MRLPRSAAPALTLLLAACASESGLQPEDKPATFDGTDDSGPPPPDTGTGTDTDRTDDSTATECAPTVTPGGSEPVDDVCAGLPWTPPADVGDFVVEWTEGGGSSYCAPVVGRLSDRDGDGDVDADDPPDIFTTDLYSGDLWRFPGDGSAADRVLGRVRIDSLVFADVDGDGTPNLLVADASTLHVCALEPDFTPLWCSNAITTGWAGSPVVADLDGDGDVEVVAVGGVVDGATGTFQTALCTGDAVVQPVLGDVDADGAPEVLCGRQLWRTDGTLIFDRSSPDETVVTTFVDREPDGVPEILVVDLSAKLSLLAADGRELATYAGNPVAVFSPPCVADLDGDGDAEFGVAHGTRFEAYDLDLAPLWSAPISDISGDASCAAFDFDADGAFELVYADEQDLFVYRGDGSVMLNWPDHSSGTSVEYPTIADIDLDGSAEIVVAEANRSSGIAVLGHVTDGWAPAEPVWADNAATGGMVLVDGTVNPAPPAPFRDGGRYHVQEAGRWDASIGRWVVEVDRPDLGVAVEDVCVADCETGPVRVGVSAWNRGPVDADAVVVLYRNDGTDLLTEVGRAGLALPAGTRGDPMVFTTDREGAFGWVVTIEAAGGEPDCDPTDDEDRWADRVCP